jgi:hypothetical protein
MIKMARFSTIAALSLAISSFLGLMARHIPPFSICLMVIFVLLSALFIGALVAGNVIDHSFGWEADTFLALSVAFLAMFIIGGIIGWLVA